MLDKDNSIMGRQPVVAPIDPSLSTDTTPKQPVSVGGGFNPAPRPDAKEPVGAGGTPGAAQGVVPSGGFAPPQAPGVARVAPPQTGISTEVPTQYKASSYAELIPQIRAAMNRFKPLSEEDLQKIRRRQKAEGIISGISDAAQAVANLFYTTQYAPDMYDPTKGMSARTKARWDREKAQRDADDEKYFNYALTLGKLEDADKARGLQAWQMEQNLARQDRAFEAGREDAQDAKEFRDKEFNRQGEWHIEEGKRWLKQFIENVRQFNVSSAIDRARLSMEAQRLAKALQEDKVTFNLGSGNGNVTLSNDKLNAQTVSRIYSTLPPSVRSQLQGDPIYQPVVKNGVIQYGIDGKPQQKVVSYKPPTTEAMLIAIGAYVESSPATQNAIKQVAGLETGKKPAGY